MHVKTVKRPRYWTGRNERLFTRMHPGVRMPLVIAAHTERRHPKNIIEDAIAELVASGDFDAAKRYKMGTSYQGCTYEIDSGVADQLRLAAQATGESIQTMLHEALIRKLGITLKEKN